MLEAALVRKIVKEYTSNKKVTCAGLARKYGIHTTTVWNNLKKNGVEIRRSGANWTVETVDDVSKANGDNPYQRKRFRLSLLKKQKYRCGICHSKLTIDNTKVDHCHTTRRIRGALCHSCNVKLGWLNDDIDFMRKAIAYLSR